MVKNFFRHMVVYGIARIVPSILTFLLLPLYTRLVKPADFGTFDLLMITTNLIDLTIALEITHAIARFFPEQQTQSDKQSFASTALGFTVFVYTCYVALAFAASGIVSPLLLGENMADTFRLGIVMTWSSGLFLFGLCQLRWQLQSRHYAISSSLAVLVNQATTATLLIFFHRGMQGILIGQIAGNFTGAACSLFWARSSFAWTFRWDRLKQMLAFSIPMVPSSVGIFVSLYIDRISIKQMMTMTDLGKYGICFRIGSVIGLAMSGFQGALMPLIYTHYRESGTPASIGRIFRYFVFVTLSLILGIGLFSQEIMTLLAPPEYRDVAMLAPLLAAAIAMGNMYIFAPGLTIAKKTRRFALISITGAVINTALNIILIPRLGLFGAGLATVLGAAIPLALLFQQSQKWYPVPHRWGALAGSTALVAGVIALVPFADHMFRPLSVGGIIFKAGIAAAIVACIVWWVVGWSEVSLAWRTIVEGIQRVMGRGNQMPGPQSPAESITIEVEVEHLK